MRVPFRTVITLRNELRGPVLAVLAFWFVTTVVLAVFARTVWLLALAAGGLLGAVGMLAWALWPRRGDLVRLILDRKRRTIWWAHHGREPEELHFSSLRAVIVEATGPRRFGRLWAVDSAGRRVALGSGTRAEMETFGRELAHAIGVPLWYQTGEELVVAEPVGLEPDDDLRDVHE